VQQIGGVAHPYPVRPDQRTSEPQARSGGPSPSSSRLEDLYERHAADAIRLAYLLTGDAPLAEDLGHEAFVKVIGRLAHLRDPGAFEAYLKRTVVNLVRMHFRHGAVERRYAHQAATMAESGSHGSDVPTTDSMRRALLALPERQRAAIVLRFYEDLPERSIAEALRCRPGTVRSLISRGLAALRDQMRGETNDR